MHTIAQYIQNCIKQNVEISPLIPINLTSVEFTQNFHYVSKGSASQKNADAQLVNQSNSRTLIIDLLNNVDFQHWKHLIDERIFNNQEQLNTIAYTALRLQNMDFLTETLKQTAKILNKHIQDPSDESYKKRVNNAINTFPKYIAINYPQIVCSQTDTVSSEFLTQINELNSMFHLLIGNKLAFNFNYSEYPIDLDAALIDENIIDNLKKQVSVITNEPYNMFSYLHPKFKEALHNVVDINFLISNTTSQLVDNKKNSTKAKVAVITSHFIDEVKKTKANVSQETITSSLLSASLLEDVNLNNNILSLKKNTPTQKSNIISSPCFSHFNHNYKESHQRDFIYLIYDAKHKRDKYHNPQEYLQCLLETVHQNITEAELKYFQQPGLLLLSNKFQSFCDIQNENAFIMPLHKNKTNGDNSFKDLIALLRTVSFMQHLKKSNSDIYLKNIKKFEKFEPIIEQACDLTKSHYLYMNKDLFRNISPNDINIFLNNMSIRQAKSEHIELAILDMLSPKQQESKARVVKF